MLSVKTSTGYLACPIFTATGEHVPLSDALQRIRAAEGIVCEDEKSFCPNVVS